MSAHHSRSIAVGQKSRSTRSGAVLTPPTRIVVLPRRHLSWPDRPARRMSRDALVPDPRAVFQAQLGVHSRRPVGFTRLGMDLRDPAGERRVGERPPRRRSLDPGVIGRARDPSTRDMIAIECSAFFASMTRPPSPGPALRREEGRGFFKDLALLGDRSQLATQTPQFVTLARAQAAALPSSTSIWRLQLRNDCGETPSSAASWGTHLPLPRSRVTASRRKSNGYGAGMNTILSQSAQRAQVSTKPGELHAASHGRWFGNVSATGGLGWCSSSRRRTRCGRFVATGDRLRSRAYAQIASGST